MRFLAVILASFILAFCPGLQTPAFADEGIAAVVNQDVISMTDLNERIKLIAISSGLPNTPEIRTKLTKQIMDSLIEEQLMLQETDKRNIKVTDSDIEQGFAALAEQNKIPSEKFKEMISHAGINISTMRRQIRAQLGWSKVIQKVMRPQVTVTDGDIDEYLAHITSNKGKEEYLLAEIFLPVDSSDQQADVQQLATKLVSEIRGGKAPFSKVAMQFSKAPGASQGGDLGWLQQEQLPQEGSSIVQAMKAKDISDPIQSADGYHIIMLRDKRVVGDANLPSRDDVMSTIGVQRLDRMQRRYLMDLKSTAFIENRVQS